jgi:hypothetical protein
MALAKQMERSLTPEFFGPTPRSAAQSGDKSNFTTFHAPMIKAVTELGAYLYSE